VTPPGETQRSHAYKQRGQTFKAAGLLRTMSAALRSVALQTPDRLTVADDTSLATLPRVTEDTRQPTALISWAHRNKGWDDQQSDSWRATVLGFADVLLTAGIIVDLDLWHMHETSIDWTRWGQRRIDENDFTIIVLSEAWRQRWEGSNHPNEGAGAVGEADALKGRFTRDQAEFQRRTVAVILPGASTDDLPLDLARLNRFPIPSIDARGIDDLVHALSQQPRFAPGSPLEANSSAFSFNSPSSTLVIRESTKSFEPVQDVVLTYDWEDLDKILSIENRLRAQGRRVVSFPALELAGRTLTGQLCIVWSQGAASNASLQGLLSRPTADPALFWVIDGAPDIPPNGIVFPQQNQAVLGIDFEMPHHHDRDEIDLTNMPVVGQDVYTYLLGDKYCDDVQTLRNAASIYAFAIDEMGAEDPRRELAVLDYAACMRFFGDWGMARSILQNEPASNSNRSSISLMLEGELISLEFELGFSNGIAGRTNSLLRECLGKGEWAGVILCHRQMGMIQQERGAYSSAREHLSLAYNYCDELRDTALLASHLASQNSRLALTVDCLRELSSIEWKIGNAASSKSMLGDAKSLCAEMHSSRPRDYLMQLTTYESARVMRNSGETYEERRAMLVSAYEHLQTFHNPTRLATVLSAIIELDMKFLRNSSSQFNSLRMDLQKVARVYRGRRHRYMQTRTLETLGDLEFAHGELPRARSLYEEARREFNRLGKQPQAAHCSRALAKCLSRLGQSTAAEGVLQVALDRLTEPDQSEYRSLLQADLARLGHPQLSETSVDNLDLLGIGEFAVHSWLRQELSLPSRIGPPGVTLGPGDDCAVLEISAEDELVVSTDTLPAGLLLAQTDRSADYAARLAVISSFADVLAMGAQPLAILTNLHLARTTSLGWTKRFMEQLQLETVRVGASLAGGDLKEEECPSLTTVAVGTVHRGRSLTRSGARVGDLILMTLSGGERDGFCGLGTRWASELIPYLSSLERSIISGIIERDASFQDLALPLKTMQAIAELRIAQSAIDTSDGLLACAQLIGEASGVGIEFDPKALSKLVNTEVVELGRVLGVDPFLFTMSAGHDWEIMFTVAPKDLVSLDSVKTESNDFPNLAVIGRVVPRENWSASGVRLGDDLSRVNYIEFFTDEKFVATPAVERAGQWLSFAADTTNRLNVDRGGSPGKQP
jgi:thiamin-phosphate kinase